MRKIRAVVAAVTVALLLAAPARGAVPVVAGQDPVPGTPAYLARDLANIAAAYGRITGPGGQLANPNYLPALIRQSSLLPPANCSPRPPTRRGSRSPPATWSRGGTWATRCARAGTGPVGGPGRSPSSTGTAPCSAAPSTHRSPARATPTPGDRRPARSRAS